MVVERVTTRLKRAIVSPLRLDTDAENLARRVVPAGGGKTHIKNALIAVRVQAVNATPQLVPVMVS